MNSRPCCCNGSVTTAQLFTGDMFIIPCHFSTIFGSIYPIL